jgi:hypothetical protein
MPAPTSRSGASLVPRRCRLGRRRRWPRSAAPLLAGIERADSITIDAHKWMATTMGCAMFITRHAPAAVRGVSCLDELHAVERRGSRSVPEQRAMVAPLPGAAPVPALAAAGWEGLGAHVERSVRGHRANQSASSSPGWTVANDSPLGGARRRPAGRTRRGPGARAPRGGLGPGLGRARPRSRAAMSCGSAPRMARRGAEHVNALIAVLNEPV